MEKNTHNEVPPEDTGLPVKIKEEKAEKEIDADDEMHKTGSDLIQKEQHHLPVDDEVKNG